MATSDSAQRNTAVALGAWTLSAPMFVKEILRVKKEKDDLAQRSEARRRGADTRVRAALDASTGDKLLALREQLAADSRETGAARGPKGGRGRSKSVDPQSLVGRQLRATFDYEATSGNQLSMRVGDVITVLDVPSGQVEGGWWTGINETKGDGREGIFPSAYTSGV